MTGMRASAIVEPSRSVLRIIDMQNYSLHPTIDAASSDGRAAVAPSIKLVESFRKSGFKVAWINSCLNNSDLVSMGPFWRDIKGNDMGMIKDGNKTIDTGPELMVGSWNLQPYGALPDVVADGIKAGADVLLNKNRLSGL